jgi:hypothetical protein
MIKLSAARSPLDLAPQVCAIRGSSATARGYAFWLSAAMPPPSLAHGESATARTPRALKSPPGDHEGAAVWRRVTARAEHSAESGARGIAVRSEQPRAATRFKVCRPALTRPRAHIVATWLIEPNLSSAVLDLNGSEGWIPDLQA